jgi:YggT family protein
MIHQLFSLISTAATLYTLLCFVRLVATWFPRYAYSPPVRFLASVCDPYLDLFRRITFLRHGGIDFTPAIAITVLMGVSSISQSIVRQGSLRVGLLLAQIVFFAWTVVSSLLGILTLLIVIRLAAQLISPASTFALWAILDRSLSPLLHKVTGKLSLMYSSWTKLLVVSLIALVIINVGGDFVIKSLLVPLLAALPF